MRSALTILFALPFTAACWALERNSSSLDGSAILQRMSQHYAEAKSRTRGGVRIPCYVVRHMLPATIAQNSRPSSLNAPSHAILVPLKTVTADPSARNAESGSRPSAAANSFP